MDEIVKRFLVLGAGASYGARPSHSRRPPLGKDLSAYLLAWLNANDPRKWDDGSWNRAKDEDDASLPYPCDVLQNVGARKRIIELLESIKAVPDELGFERTMARLWESGGWNRSRTLPRLNCILAWALTTGESSAFTAGPDLYDDLIRALEPLEGLAVITLNYDILFEEAVQRRYEEGRIWYPGLRFGQTQLLLPVYKLHGSCNWFTLHGGSRSASLEVALSNAIPLSAGSEGTFDTQREHAVLGSRSNLLWHMKRNHGAFEPLMAIYMPGKKVLTNWKGVTTVRESCHETIRANPSADVTVIGVHIPQNEQDNDLYECLQELGKLSGQKLFVSPSSSEIEASQQLGFIPRKLSLENYIKELVGARCA